MYFFKTSINITNAINNYIKEWLTSVVSGQSVGSGFVVSIMLNWLSFWLPCLSLIKPSMKIMKL